MLMRQVDSGLMRKVDGVHMLRGFAIRCFKGTAG